MGSCNALHDIATATQLLQASGQLHDLERDAIDVGIRFGTGSYPGMAVERLMGDSYYPVASPHYDGGNIPTQLAQIKGARLLLSDEPWTSWFKAAGL